MAMENSVSRTQKLKIILLGDSRVGKTALINQYVYKNFQQEGFDFKEVLTQHLEMDGKHVLLEIQDTGGQERHGARGLEAAFYNNAKGCMLVYDVNDPDTFDSLENWHNQCITRVGDKKGFPFIVLGNKVELDGGKNSPVNERARMWCQSKGPIHLFLASAKKNKNVVEAFHYIVELAINHETKIEMDYSPKVSKDKPDSSIIPSMVLVPATKERPQNIPNSDEVTKNSERSQVNAERKESFEGINPQNFYKNEPYSSPYNVHQNQENGPPTIPTNNKQEATIPTKNKVEATSSGTKPENCCTLM